MKHFTITIGREFGCNAREIGRQTAAVLGVKFYDKELVTLAAKEGGVEKMTFFAPKEHPGITDNFQTEFGYGISGMFYSPKAVEAQAGVIRKIAGSENCVMLGRCSDYFLQDLNSTLSIFVYAPLSYRVTHISQAYGLTQKQAQKMIAKIDRKRHRYYKYITGKNRGDRHGRNLMIDVEKFGVEGAVKIITDAAKLLFSE